MGQPPFSMRSAHARGAAKEGFQLARRTMVLAILASVLTGCGLFGADKPPPKEIEIKPAADNASLDLVAVASPLVNPGPDGTPSSVVIRLYQLKGDANFVNANFRQLWEDDATTLGPTLLGKTEIYLTPGAVQNIKANLIKDTTLVAVVVGFRNFETAKWRAMVPLTDSKSLKLKASIESTAVELGPQD